MSLRLVITAGKIIGVFHKEELLEFRYSLWGNMNPSVSGTIFGALNGYLATLTEGNQSKLFECYRRSLEILEQESDQSTILNLLKDESAKIYSLTNYQGLRKFLLEGGHVKPCLQTSESLVGNNPQETTYVRDEILELTMFAVYVRLLAPMCGTATRVISGVSSNLFKEMETLKIITGTGFDKEQPYERLALYCSSYATRRKTTTSTAVKFRMPVEDLETYILGLFVLRRLMPYELDKSDNIIRYAFKFIEGKVGKMRQGFTDKMGNVSKSGQGEDSLIDHFRIAEAIPGAVRSATNVYLKDIALVCSHTGFNLNVKAIEKRAKQLSDNELETNDLYIPIIALCLNKLIHRWVINTIDRESMMSAIAISEALLREMGLHDIATWLTSNSYLKETTDISLGASGKTLTAMRSDLSELLITRYPHLPEGGYTNKVPTPAHFVIEECVKMINIAEWNGDTFEEFLDIRNSFAKLFITPPEKFLNKE